MQQETESNESPVTYPKDYNPELNGIDGWLIFIVLGLVMTAASGIVYFFNYFSIMCPVNIRLGIEMGIQILVNIAGSVWILVMLYRRKILFRKLYIIQMIVGGIYLLLLFIFSDKYLSDAYFSTDTIIGLAITTIRSVICIIYLYKSKRVKNTFIYPFQYPARPLKVK